MPKITYFDVEYANSKNKSICQIGIMCEDWETGEPVYPELNIYVNPEDGFDNMCIGIHGITPDKVKNAPPFPEVWKTIEKYFTNAIVVGHNVASSDLNALARVLNRYHLDIPVLYYICTYDLSKKYIPSYCIENYSMSCLCEYFNIDIDSEHNAFDDACACADLFKTLTDLYEIDLNDQIKKYDTTPVKSYTPYVDDYVLRKTISDFYGMIRGFSIDDIISTEELQYIIDWRNEHQIYASHPDTAAIIQSIDQIIADGKVTINESISLQGAIKNYLHNVTTSPVTLATQILDGILKGIIVDGEITEKECCNLRQWLYDNIYLSDHFPFDRTIELLEKVLEDSVLTQEESAYVTSVIQELLNPIDALKQQVYSVEGKHICLSGNFTYGTKAAVEDHIISLGGIIDTAVKMTTDILIIGNQECQAYSNGTYGTKVKKAIEYNKKGCNITITKESEIL